MSFTGTFDTDLYLFEFLNIKDLCQLIQINKSLYNLLLDYNRYIDFNNCFGENNIYDIESDLNEKVRKIYSKIPTNSLYETCLKYKSNELFAKSCIYGNLKIVKFINDIYGINISETLINYIFMETYKRDKFEITQWLLNEKKISIGRQLNCMAYYIKNNSLEKILSLLKILPEIDYNINTKITYSLFDLTRNTFIKICMMNNLEIAKIFFKKYFNVINLYKFGNSQVNHLPNIFTDLCFSQIKIEIMNWLYKIIENDFIMENKKIWFDKSFINSCKSQNKEIADWLCTLKKDYKIIIEDNRIIKYIIPYDV